jgi:hypothetical protein
LIITSLTDTGQPRDRAEPPTRSGLLMLFLPDMLSQLMIGVPSTEPEAIPQASSRIFSALFGRSVAGSSSSMETMARVRLAALDVDIVCVGHGDVLMGEPLRAWQSQRSAH